MNVEQFAAARGRRLTQADEELRPLVVAALGNWGEDAWWADLVEGAGVLWLEIFEREGGTDPASGLAEFNEALGETLRLTMDPSNAPAGQVDRVTEYVGTMAVNDATYRAARAGRAMGMRWVAMDDASTRLTHARADGQIVSVRGTFQVGEARLRFPGDPRGPLDEIMGCFPASVKVQGRATGGYRRWYSGAMVTIETEGGQSLTGTPNHPILTRTGWIPLGLLQEGDEVVRYHGNVESPVSHDIDGQPAEISEVFDALAEVRDSVRVSGRGMDFHGDGLDADVDIVGIDSQLGEGGESSADKFIRQFLLPATDAGAGFLQGQGALSEMLGGEGDPSDSRVGGGGPRGLLLGAAPRAHDPVGLSVVSQGNVLLEERVHGGSPDSGSASESILGLTGEISFDPVLRVSRVENWSGHVYNLSTESGAYACNGIIAHNCRCVLMPVRRERAMSAEKLDMLNAARERLMGAIVADASEEEGDGIHVAEDDGDEELIPDEIPWHGVLAPMGVRSGDRRMFTEGALSNRELPLPLMYQRASVGEHNGAVQVARIDRIEYYPEENPRLALGYGAILTRIPESDDVIAGAIDGALRGVSVDVDDVHEMVQELEVPDNATELELDEIRQNYVSTYDQGRIMGATIVAFPAFPEAYFTLGEEFQEGELDLILARLDGDEEALAAAGCVACEEGTDEYISEAPWDGDAANYTDEQWFRATLIHTNGDSRVKSDNKLPILTPSGELSRAGVHAAAARINQVDADPDLIARAKAALRAAYEDLGEDAPEVIAASAAEEAEESFARGPGWLTNPAGTRRIHDYWVRGKGALKIRWGTPGSFNRCRRQLAKYIQPQWLAGTCAQWYHDATGIWPGVKRGDKGLAVDGDMAPAFTLAASAERRVLPGEWFRDPGLHEPTPLTITDDGRVFGHVAQFGVCHIGIPGVCTTAPHSATDYAYYKVGMVETTDGMVTVGQITMDTGHADLRLGARPAAAHYDNTGVVVADVTVGEDDIGIWMAGAVRPSATEDQIERLRAAGRVSGDWRQIGGNLEMVGLLAVNVPGFPVPRTAVAASASGQTSLVAAGIVAPEVEELDSGVDELAELVEQVTERVEERQARRARVAAAQEKVQGLRTALAEKRSQRLERARAKLERI